MKTSGPQRPIGFHPSETSALTNDLVVQQHAGEAAFLWTMRDRAVHSPLYALKDINRVDGRVEAHLDGLRTAGSFGRELWQNMLDSKQSGEYFAVGALAFESGHSTAIEKILSSCGKFELMRGVVAGLGWIPFEHVKERIRELLTAEELVARRVGIAAAAIHRACPTWLLHGATTDRDPFLRARAYRAIGEMGVLELLPRLRGGFGDSDEGARFAAAWSATRLSENLDSIATLRLIAESTSRYAYDAVALAVRRMKNEAANQWLLLLAKRKEKVRTALVGAAATGDPSLIPWIMDQMSVPNFARAAGRAFSMITGANLEFEDLDCNRPAEFGIVPNDDPKDAEVAMEEDTELRWPDTKEIARWWKKRQADFVPGKRFLCGKAITDVVLREVLAKGFQPDRAAAALEISLQDPTMPLFEVRSRAEKQYEDLQKW
ncbi:MAG: TIGR02270 family protein, partial [Verrucomicrobia bacterium]|nr:TIGR02270 family protein [Verrucomicrobiota bacterium]